MQTDEEKRSDFIIFLKELSQNWTINQETEKCIISVILRHKESELDTYIAYFKLMINRMEQDIKTKKDNFKNNHPADGKYVDSFIGASINTQNYASNYSLHLFFSQELKEIYGFQVLK
jgi:transcription initiation factor TFIID subunit TAF12